MMSIDTTNPSLVYESEDKKADLDYEQRKKGFYDVDDFAIITATDFLNLEHIIKAICKVPFVVHTNNVAHSAIYNILRDKYNIDPFKNEAAYEEFIKMTHQYSPLSSQYRSTVHLTLNGLVSNHNLDKGSFDNRNFIVVDKLNKHLGIDDFRSIRMEDTFVFGEFPISKEAIILINEARYPELLKAFPFLNTYNIVLFRGDEKTAVEMLLTSMNVMPEKIEEHSAEYSKRTELHKQFFSSVTKQYGIEQVKHVYSPEYKEDDEKNLLLWQIYDTKFYNELFDYFAVKKEEKEQMIAFLTSYGYARDEQTKMLQQFIINVGLENYQQFVLRYNQNIMDAISQGIYPTNEEILSDGSIVLKGDRKAL